MRGLRHSIFLTLAAILLLTTAIPTQAATGFTYTDGWYAPSKYATAVLDYEIYWGLWLNGDTIASSTWTADTGITITNDIINQNAVQITVNNQPITAVPLTLVTIWISGGTSGTTYNVNNTVTTVAGRTNMISFKIKIK